MKFDAAVQALGSTAWAWSETAFAALAAELGLRQEPDGDPLMPLYTSPWGKEWVQAMVGSGGVERVEFLVEETAPRWRPFTAKKVEALRRKYHDKLVAYVKRASAVLGTPTFHGDTDASGVRDDEDALALAVWPRDTARIMVTMRNAGRDTPFWISIVVRPLAHGRLVTSRPSSSLLEWPPSRSSSAALVGAPLETAIEVIRTRRWDWSEPALRQLAQMLPLPATVSDSRVELTIESIAPSGGTFDDDKAEELDHAFCAKFDSYVERTAKLLGRPKFSDGFAARDWPSDEAGNFLALWPLPNARLMLLYRNVDASSPFTLSLIVRP